MGNHGDKAKGTWDKVAGKVKEEVGDALDNERMEAEGHAQHTKGEAQVEAAKARGRAEGTADEWVGKAKKNIGDTIDDESMEAEGHAQELKGKANREMNR